MNDLQFAKKLRSMDLEISMIIAQFHQDILDENEFASDMITTMILEQKMIHDYVGFDAPFGWGYIVTVIAGAIDTHKKGGDIMAGSGSILAIFNDQDNFASSLMDILSMDEEYAQKLAEKAWKL